MFMNLSHGLENCNYYGMTETCRNWLAADPLFLYTETTGLDDKAEIVEIAKQNQASLSLRYPMLVSSSFGLLHGFGFASVLAEIGLPANVFFGTDKATL